MSLPSGLDSFHQYNAQILYGVSYKVCSIILTIIFHISTIYYGSEYIRLYRFNIVATFLGSHFPWLFPNFFLTSENFSWPLDTAFRQKLQSSWTWGVVKLLCLDNLSEFPDLFLTFPWLSSFFLKFCDFSLTIFPDISPDYRLRAYANLWRWSARSHGSYFKVTCEYQLYKLWKKKKVAP